LLPLLIVRWWIYDNLVYDLRTQSL